jgi:hypothetical protein
MRLDSSLDFNLKITRIAGTMIKSEYNDFLVRSMLLTRFTNGGKEKSTGHGDQIAGDDPRFGDEQIVFNRSYHIYIMR